MLSTVNSILLNGLDGCLVEVQADVSNGLPCWEVVGLPDASVREAKERVKIAIKNSGYHFPSKRIVINLSPANTRKEGSFFDLPIAIAILSAMGIIQCENIKDYIFLGELSLDGKIVKTIGVLPMCIESKKIGIKNIILSKENFQEACLVENINVIPAENLGEIVRHLNSEEKIKYEKFNVLSNKNQIKNTETIDFSEVKGQENVKRALEIAAAGGHNCVMIGNPGSGKTMLARRITTILPDLTFEEALETTKIHSVAGKINDVRLLMASRPFRSPHHTISPNSLVGGGKIPKPGEISLAHNGVLFLDELPEFNKNTLEVLRGPMEDRSITLSRVSSVATYPCNFMLIASMNPCPCGYYGSEQKECYCSPQAISKYIGKISGPLLDRIDINIYVNPVKYEKLSIKEKTETSQEIKNRVNKARKIQQNRYKENSIYSNAELTPNLIEKYCQIDETSQKLMKNAFEKLNLSARAYNRILKVARTITDLEEKEHIEPKHIAEAIQYRILDKNIWNTR